jgi:hypothetical protein
VDDEELQKSCDLEDMGSDFSEPALQFTFFGGGGVYRYVVLKIWAQGLQTYLAANTCRHEACPGG